MDGHQKENGMPYSKTGERDQDEKLLQPFKYILQVPGKQIRAKLAHAFNYWLKIPADKLNAVGDIVQMLHNSSLLIDDIQDNSVLRRGIPVAHSIYGVASTINAANYVFFIALERVLGLGHPEATTVYTEQLLELHRGQETGGLFMLAIRLMQLFSENKADFTKLAAVLGLYFQIRDDYCNLCLQEYSENKSFCEDLTEGKFSFPIIHAITSQPDDRQVIHILRQRTHDVEVKKYCITLLEKYGSFDYTRQTLEQLDIEARAEVERLGGNPLMEALLDALLTWKNGAQAKRRVSITE
ncbi:geranylgeranyl pyrophosphate synthase isoform X2 [Schistocerca piceifrons]|uniref:geranylgeranyl pyrophosphate synthase isoform X2 n=1 Tax=Schistocerca piceifrons TaxID=274613 RepID=UPI001F5F3F76|nr:geranylgeranyl pyrophosphate synthase isoform X2 [Schistocerca piceifrons]XP_049762991.1 terpene synthase isoform X2 [Schistocerca cancellata]XP_049804355.1 terpene synthase isoform X2 [Schistocerca nitens]XP_049834683.1 terpene synthase isoform X2 [Schistocerca gregaria]XP_049939396.1 terpene synthase isoform X2 [Schistocerca serialis cubense]